MINLAGQNGVIMIWLWGFPNRLLDEISVPVKENQSGLAERLIH